METINNGEKISICGREYSIVGKASKEEINLYAQYVNEKLEQALKDSKRSLNVDVLILAALNMAEEYFKTKNERDEALEMLAENGRVSVSADESKYGSNIVVIDYEGVKNEILGLENECEKARREVDTLKNEKMTLEKKIDSLNNEINSIKEKNLQMQLFIPQ